MNDSRPAVPRWIFAVIAVIFAAIFLLVFAKAMFDGLNHDEHQFVAPAVLLGKLQPYRDFPLFHLPLLTLIFAALNSVFGHPFLCARIFNVCCATATVWIVFCYAWKKTGASLPGKRLMSAGGVAALMLFSPLFIVTTGKAWNHDLPVLLTVVAILLHLRAARGTAPVLCVLVSGLCVGFAVGSRLTFAPLVAPFFVAIFLFPQTLRRRFFLTALFSAAVAAALLPVFWYVHLAREQFLFGNFEYPRLRLLDPDDVRAHKTVKLWRKVRFFVKEIAVTNPGIVLVFFAVAAPVLLRRARTRDFESLFFVLLIPFVLFGCFAPTRYQYQHFYLIVPLFVLAITHALANWSWPRSRKIAFGFVAALTFFSVAKNAHEYHAIMKIAQVDQWEPIAAYRFGEQIKTLAGEGKVMTFAPIFPVEGGAAIYPEFATGVFASRLAHLVPAERRAKLHVVARDDISAFLDSDPPAAILLGFELPEVEESLRDYAQRNGYKTRYKRKGIELLVAQH